jgi:ABC-type nickel/cobalt efflux system permease component RcnA
VNAPSGSSRTVARRPRDAFTALIATPEISASILVFAALLAAALGAFHALEPGHGKTVVAAYLVGSRGTARHALLLGLIVTASHTAGVYLLGGITLYASRYIVPERLYPWLGAVSGLIIAALGFALFLRRYAGRDEEHGHAHSGHDHVHDHARGHQHHDHGHGDGHEHGHDHAHDHGMATGTTITFPLARRSRSGSCSRSGSRAASSRARRRWWSC